MAQNWFRLDDFELYQTARAFRRKIYQVVRRLPPAEKYALDPQMRRGAISITNNIAEGHGRWHFQENTRFCRISRGSLDEVIDDLNICIDEHYGDLEALESLKDEAYGLIARINGYIGYLQKCKQGGSE